MTKISVALASVLVLAAASSSVAFAAIGSSRTALTQGEAINQCRMQEQPDQNMREHHAHLARQACVERLTNASQSTSN
jgi:hypothetical protein